MLKSFIRFLIFLAVLCGIGYLAFHPFLNWLSAKAMNYTVARLQSPNLVLSDPSFRDAGFIFPNTLVWKDFGMTARIKPRDASQRILRAKVKAETLVLEAEEFFSGLFVIHVKGLRVTQEYISKSASPAYEDSPEELQEGIATARFRLDMTGFSGIKMQIRNFAAEMKKFTEEAKTAIPVQLSAKEILKVRGNSYAVDLRIVKKGDAYHLVADRGDLEVIGRKILAKNQVLTQADIGIISNNPFRAPQLLRIRSKASNEAASAYTQNPKVPEHAYRHILWSYLLAKEYGPDFAKRVTDAHEVSSDEGGKEDSSIKAHHAQDLANNELGRRYAASGYGESDILKLAMTDPHVVR
ncbi:MAG: hypothetical protein JXA73_07945 [Acidobacteria bacterium]|nr:hypothetical protein [Acidobacteriota bacterium]